MILTIFYKYDQDEDKAIKSDKFLVQLYPLPPQSQNPDINALNRFWTDVDKSKVV